MSRRRRKYTTGRMLNVICTGRGAHSKQVLAKSPEWTVVVAEAEILVEVRPRAAGLRRAQYYNAPVGSSYEMHCPSCGRNLRLSVDNIEKLLRKLADSGGLDFDISMV